MTDADGLLTVDESRCRARIGVKWAKYGPEVLPAWVADMDFDPPGPVLDAIRGHLDRGDLGYGPFAADLIGHYANWQERQHGWRPDAAGLRAFTSALHALEVALWNTTERGDGVVVFTPIYYPFLDAIAASGRRRVDVPLDPDGWRIDPDRLAASIDDTTRVILFCNPHNPTGRVFDVDEIAAVAAIAERHDLLVITDEIWGELVHPGAVHRPLAICDDRFRRAAGHPRLGEQDVQPRRAAYRCRSHRPRTADRRARRRCPATSKVRRARSVSSARSLRGHSATTGWLPCSARSPTAAISSHVGSPHELPSVGFDPARGDVPRLARLSTDGPGDDPAETLLEHFGVALSSGPKFGPDSAGFARINFATSEQILDRVIDRIAEAVEQHQ